MKNANGQGSVSKMSGNRRMKYRVLAPATLQWSTKKEDYVYHQKTIGYAKTKAEAFSILYKYTQNPQLFAPKMTFSQLYNIYYNTKEKVSSPASLSHIKRVYSFMSPYLNTPFENITYTHIQNLVNSSTYSKNTLNTIKAYLHNLWQFAIVSKITNINIIEFVKVPPLPKVRQNHIYTEEEITNIWAQEPTDARNLLLIYLYTGLRRNELFSILKTNIFISDRYLIGGLKTKAGRNRVVPIHKKILPIIQEYYSKSDYYLIDENILNFAISCIKIQIDKLNKKIGNKSHLIHDTRKTFISRLNNYGGNITDIAKIVGHSTGIITLDVYTIKDREQLIKTVDLLP